MAVPGQLGLSLPSTRSPGLALHDDPWSLKSSGKGPSGQAGMAGHPTGPSSCCPALETAVPHGRVDDCFR